MADDIEEFLRRVAEKRRGQQGNRAAQPKPQQPPPRQQPPRQQPRQQPSQPAPPPPARPPLVSPPPPVIQRRSEPPLAELADTSIQPISTDEVQRHAQQYMSRKEFDERSKQVGLHAKPLSHLESNVAKAHAALSTDAKRGIVAAAESPSLAAATPLTEMLKSREAFRSAFLLSLILDKPAWKDD